jgi:hypothetical protein
MVPSEESLQLAHVLGTCAAGFATDDLATCRIADSRLVAIGDLIAQQLVRRHGLSIASARKRSFFLDSKGLVCAARRAELQPHKLPFAHDRSGC